MIAAGIFSGKKGIFDKDVLIGVINHMAGSRKELIPVNIKAVERGIEIAGGGK